jgi:hypothetical protein
VFDLAVLDSKRKRIQFLFENAPHSTQDMGELRAHWARYVCVVISGYLESTLREILLTYVTNRCPTDVTRYVSKQLGSFQNAKLDKIFVLIESFNPYWHSSLLNFIDDEHRDAINSIVGHRHAIAHGDLSNPTLGSLKKWYEKANDVIDYLVTLCA